MIDIPPVSDQIRSALLARDIATVDNYFYSNGAEAPVVVWDPQISDIREPQLQRLREFWDSRRDGRNGAPVSSIDPSQMRFALGYLMLLDVLDNGADFRYRLYGSLIAERFGRDITGQTVRMLGLHEYIVGFFLAAYQAVLDLGRPLYTTHFPRPGSETSRWSRLILPLVDDAGTVSRLLVGQVPGEWRPRPPGVPAPAI